MPGLLPLLPPTALDYFASLVADDDSLPLLETAIAIAQHEYPLLDTQSTLAEIDALAARLKTRIAPDAMPMHRLRLLNRFFFQELGFSGNINDYYDPRNSYVHAVLETRRGIPITLALIYVELATEIGLEAHGISFPGHFLARVRMPQGDIVIDPFTGQSMSRDALDALLVPHRRRLPLSQHGEPPFGAFLQTARPREVIARMLRNLKEIFRGGQDSGRLLGVAERLVILLPDAWEERRDRGLIHAALGARLPAMADLAGYLENAPDAPDRPAIRKRLAELGHDGASRLH
ncbi:MAG: tetratricopeptide repeat protein [Pseudomonadota bacterium]|nr:tetratricopeptide repeat protein [Pseudomonadota bacterium]